MLADAPLPHGCDATFSSVGSLSKGFERSVASPLQPSRLRAMGRTVWSVPPCQTIHPTAFQVAVCFVSYADLPCSLVWSTSGKSARFRARWFYPYSWRNRYLLHYRAAFAFSLTCCPHRPRYLLRCTFPPTVEGAVWIYPVPLKWRDGLGPPCTPAALFTHDGGRMSHRTHCIEPRSILGSSYITTLTGVCVFWPYHQA